jgi:hypothetical protein
MQLELVAIPVAQAARLLLMVLTHWAVVLLVETQAVHQVMAMQVEQVEHRRHAVAVAVALVALVEMHRLVLVAMVVLAQMVWAVAVAVVPMIRLLVGVPQQTAALVQKTMQDHLLMSPMLILGAVARD